MCRRILSGFPQIVRSGDNHAIADEEGGDGDFADQRGFAREAEGLLHELFIQVVGQRHRVVIDSRQRESASVWAMGMLARLGRESQETFVGGTEARFDR